MTRRTAAMLLGVGARAWAGPRKRLDQVIGDIPGAALLVDVRTPALLAVHAANVAGGLLVPPGSAIKPFTIEALLRGGKLTDSETFACPGTLTIGGRSFNCSHPALAQPVDARTALAYSCNCFVAHFAERFAQGELAAHLIRCGLSSPSGWLGDGEGSGLQAIGEGGVMVTAAEMAVGYRRLAVSASDAIRSGLEGAVEFGTAQRARVAGAGVAGKTGSVRALDGVSFAWFCGFAPSRAASAAVR